MLEVKNIHKKFGTNEVLKGVDFKVEKGSVIAVLGNSGSGKTTLLRCISFLEQADKGEITFDDFHKDITAVTRKEIRQLRMKMGFVFQGYNLFRNKTALACNGYYKTLLFKFFIGSFGGYHAYTQILCQIAH